MTLTGDFLGETPVAADVVAEVAATEVVHDQVEVLAVLERIVHVHDEGVLELRKDLSLVDHRLDAPLRDDPRLAHLFHREELLGFLAFDEPHFAEASFADAKVINEVPLVHSYKNRWSAMKTVKATQKESRYFKRPTRHCFLFFSRLSNRCLPLS